MKKQKKTAKHSSNRGKRLLKLRNVLTQTEECFLIKKPLQSPKNMAKKGVKKNIIPSIIFYA